MVHAPELLRRNGGARMPWTECKVFLTHVTSLCDTENDFYCKLQLFGFLKLIFGMFY